MRTRETQATPPRQARIQRTRGRRRPVRPDFERLEDRHLLTSDPVNLGQFLQFRLEDPGAEWTVNAGVFSATGAVSIGFNPGVEAYVPMLAIEKGVSLDTVLNQFTITATPQAHNTLNYFPGGEIQRLAPLFEFQNSYEITADTFVTAGVTPGGDVLAPGASVGVSINDVGSNLSPSSIQLRHQGGAASGPAEVAMHGTFGLAASSKFSALRKLLDKLHVEIGSSTDYYVGADPSGNVKLISKSGQGFYVDITPNQTFDLGGFASVTVIAAQFSWDEQNKLISIGGQFSAQLNDDDGTANSNATPFYFNMGTTADPGFVLDYSQSGAGVIKKLFASFQKGVAGGRNAVNTGGATISLQDLIVLYDSTLKDGTGKPYDAIGIGGEVDFNWGEPAARPRTISRSSSATPPTTRRGSCSTAGSSSASSGEIDGQFTFAKTTLAAARADVDIKYAASTEPGHTGTVCVSGTLVFTNVEGASITVGTQPGAPSTSATATGSAASSSGSTARSKGPPASPSSRWAS